MSRILAEINQNMIEQNHTNEANHPDSDHKGDALQRLVKPNEISHVMLP